MPKITKRVMTIQTFLNLVLGAARQGSIDRDARRLTADEWDDITLDLEAAAAYAAGKADALRSRPWTL